MHAILSWDRAVPLKVQRLAGALVAGGAELRRDLDADGVRHRAVAAGHPIMRITGVDDLVTFALRTAPAPADAWRPGVRSAAA